MPFKMKTSVSGFPRIGENRELKRIIESFWDGAFSLEDVRMQAREIRKKHWLLQKNSGIDYIPSNDFSCYDNILDTAFLLNMIPQRYREAGLDETGTYFAMARGYQKDGIDLKPLEMKKWFTTNYHFMVPEIEDSTELRLNGTKPFDEYTEAMELGISTKPVITGPFTMLKLARLRGTEKEYSAFIDGIVPVYREILERLSGMGCGMIQLDEPVLVTDLDAHDIASFESCYGQLLNGRGEVQVLLQTCFGDVRDIYPLLAGMGFDALGLDFVEGRRNMSLIREKGFPEKTLLFAGVVNGRNVWVNDYEKTLALVDELSRYVDAENIVAGTSCSLLHVPYSTGGEKKMDPAYRRHLSFASEKLKELSELAGLATAKERYANPVLSLNRELVEEKKKSSLFRDEDVRRAVAAVSEEQLTRKTHFSERIELQKERLKLPPLPTTTIGSFPQTAEVRKLRAMLRKGLIGEKEYHAEICRHIAEVISLQEEIGLDVLVHGEFERNDMVEYFGENLSGFVFTENGWVQSYGTRGVKPPIIFGDVKRERPITVEWTNYARSLTAKPVKGMLTGPITILNWSFPREDLSLRDIAFQIALAIRQEVLDLEKTGTAIIQIDEAALREKLPLRLEDRSRDYLEWAIRAFRLVHSGVRDDTQIHTHMCYSEFSDIMDEIKQMDADVISIEAARSDLSILESLKNNHYDKQVGPGVYDIHSARIPDIGEIAALLRKIIVQLGSDSIWVNPDCGLKTRRFEEVVPSLRNMVAAALTVRNELA